jgi:hypothetical protein
VNKKAGGLINIADEGWSATLVTALRTLTKALENQDLL